MTTRPLPHCWEKVKKKLIGETRSFSVGRCGLVREWKTRSRREEREKEKALIGEGKKGKKV